MRVRNEHWVYLINFAESHPEIITNKFGKNGKQCISKLWETLVNGLNAMGFGEKSVVEWKKALTDWKSKTKLKASEIRTHLVKTGGGPSTSKVLSDVEERLIKIMGNKAIEGDIEVQELGFSSTNASCISQPPFLQVTSQNNIFEGTQETSAEINPDHNNYCTNSSTRKRKIISTTTPRKRNSAHSKELLELSQNTVNILQDISNSLSTISGTFIEIKQTICEIKDNLLK